MLFELIKPCSKLLRSVWSMQEIHFNGLLYAILCFHIQFEYAYNPGTLDYKDKTPGFIAMSLFLNYLGK